MQNIQSFNVGILKLINNMENSIKDYLIKELDCDEVLDCFLGLKELDKRIFRLLAQNSEFMSVDEISEEINRERSTTYRSIQRLLQAGLIQKKQINYDEGGYCHVYITSNSEEIANELQRMLNDWYATMGQLIDEFREKYKKEKLNN